MEYLFSVEWKQIIIGRCYYSKDKYIFIYDKDGINETSKLGFNRLIGFPDINQIYVSSNLFSVFQSRVISSKRSNHLTDKEKVNFLINTEGKLITDNISIKDEGKGYVKKRI